MFLCDMSNKKVVILLLVYFMQNKKESFTSLNHLILELLQKLRLATVFVNSINLSANVLLPWSICATMQKLRILLCLLIISIVT